MKKILFALLVASAIIMAPEFTRAQAWEKETKVLALGFGASQFFHIDNYYYGTSTFRNWYWPITGQLNFQGEFGIHKYVGIGFTTGLGGRAGLLYGYAGEVNVPVGVIANFHFYQLIADKTGKDIHSDKLDIYAGANVGAGLAATFYTRTTRVIPIAFGGIQAGVRYYFTPRFGVNGEIGFGKSLVNAGLVFKL